ncbi:MAG: 4Fe-4S dicluster domain-containing protein [Clostridiales bacterium]|nr:4Fe-4S dicluster domain-containing protein [Clostridiales bacterium]
MAQLTMVVELDRCIGCRGGCQVACKTENEIALGPSRSKFYTMGPTGHFPDIEMYFMPVMCQQCANPSCTEVCPTGACYKDEEDGVIYIDRDVCIGCQSCMRACPYEANLFNRELHVMDKCNLCVQRREDGLEPACVRNCAGGALHVGDIDDPESEVSKLLATNEGHVYTLKDENGNEPTGRFILKNCKWIDELPFDFERRMKGEK